MKPSVSEWVHKCHDLMPQRANCWIHCSMSDAVWTEWKNYSLPSSSFAEWPHGSTSRFAIKPMTPGMKLRCGSDSMQSATSIQVQRNVQRLRISRSLTCADLNAALTYTPVSAMKPSSPFGSVSGVSATCGRTFWRFCGRGNGKQALIDESTRELLIGQPAVRHEYTGRYLRSKGELY